MRKTAALLAACLVAAHSAAAADVRLSSGEIALGEAVEITVSEPMEGYRYTMRRGGDEKLFSGDYLPRGSGFYLPRQTGDYTVSVLGRDADGREDIDLGSASFTVREALSCTLAAETDSISLGEAALFHAEARGGVPGYQYLFAVTCDGAPAGAFITQGPDFEYVPEKAGVTSVTVTVTDRNGNEAAASDEVEASAFTGIDIDGSLGSAHAQGDIRVWTVRSPGVWTAEVAGSCAALSRTEGMTGDRLVVRILPGEEEASARVTFRSASAEKTVTVARSGSTGEDEEYSLFGASEDALRVDGGAFVTWMDAAGEKSFAVSASGEWTFAQSGDFFSVSREGGSLTVRAEENAGVEVRRGSVCLTCGTAQAWVYVLQPPRFPEPDLTLRGTRTDWPAEETAGRQPVAYDQCDGSWADVKYSESKLQTSGCAIFALSSALHLLGHDEPEAEPAALAAAYGFALVDGGTLNATLVGNAGKQFNYRTRYELYDKKPTVVDYFEKGAVFSFSIVRGHIALADRISADHTMIHIVDSAMSATSERIRGASMYLEDGQGGWREIADPSEVPGARYFIETGNFSGGQYWLPADYVIGRGLRLILPRDE